MYATYWINVLSGKLYCSGNPKSDMIEGVDGWKKLNVHEWNLIILAISNHTNVKETD